MRFLTIKQKFLLVLAVFVISYVCLSLNVLTQKSKFSCYFKFLTVLSFFKTCNNIKKTFNDDIIINTNTKNSLKTDIVKTLVQKTLQVYLNQNRLLNNAFRKGYIYCRNKILRRTNINLAKG
ncbi:hypothetical protein BpHYR1_041657 [Brachionus plicatilis]|uniref:Uncharacterized protein n=1 Tax=Brachionus plicatilis TaxID=10195 RepID=A0A3M7STN1_BRAPC|nr:hypothetical protein BpHYR1_041657 [Brachionus plicatilis]